MLKSKIKKVFTIVLATTLLFCLVFAGVVYAKQNIMQWEHPDDLSNKTETIEVSYVAWACACANWLPIPRENPDAEILDTDCIFIEAATDEVKVPESFFDENYNSKKLRITGNFYNEEGISRTYESPTSQKPDKAKVFRYTKIEVLER